MTLESLALLLPLEPIRRRQPRRGFGGQTQTLQVTESNW